MRHQTERVAELLRRAEQEREQLVGTLADILEEVERRRLQWKMAGMIAGGLAAAGTVAYKLFGRFSLSARLGRVASVASLLLGLSRAVLRLRRFW